MVRYAEISELESETYEVGEEIWGMDSTINENGAVDMRVVRGREDGRLVDDQ